MKHFYLNNNTKSNAFFSLSMAKISIFVLLTVEYIIQKYKENTLLSFQGKDD
jgi:hypothetical protein